MSQYQQRQPGGTRHSPPKPNPLSSASTNTGFGAAAGVGPGGAQYVEYQQHPQQPTSQLRSGPGSGPGSMTSPPTTPFHLEDARLLASQPNSPGQQDFVVTPIPVPSKTPTRSASANSSFTPSPLNHLHSQHQQQPLLSPSSTQSTFSSVPNPFSAASRGGSTAAIVGLGNGNGVPSRPASRGSITPFPAYNVNNPTYSQGHPNAYPGSSNVRGAGGSGLPSGAAEDGVIATLGLGPNSSGFPSSLGARGTGSMVLYRLADDPRGSTVSSSPSGKGVASRSASGSSKDPLLHPPRHANTAGNRSSLGSSTGDGDSIISYTDSKYPFNNSYGGGGAGGGGPGSTGGSVRGLVPYVYDPIADENEPLDEEDLLHDPNPRAWMSGKYKGLAEGNYPSVKGGRAGPNTLNKGGKPGSGPGLAKGEKRLKTIWEKKHFPWRGVVNVGVLVLLVLGLLCLFAFYPILTFYREKARNAKIEGNIRINATGQAAALFQMPDPIDAETPDDARSRTGFDGQAYELVFSDEFNKPGRTFWPGDDPFWEGVDLWYGATQDMEWYDPNQLTTRDGALIITMDSTATTTAGITPGSTAPFTEADNHNMTYRSGMVQTWNKFCFTTGYIEVAVTFPGPDQQTRGYWPGAWTMGNLARPGYAATTDGLWPYTYDTCDVGTFPNQTFKDGSGPAAALHSDKSRANYNFDLSWLPGQRLSACSCPGSDHPGPTVGRGRGAPEIDIFEAEKDKDIAIGHIVSQSGQFAPFSHDYLYSNDSGGWTNFDTTRTRANTYRGSAVQQSVSGLTRVPTDMFQGQPGGGTYRTFGFEYWSDPNDRESGSITWQVDGSKSHRVIASAVGPDQGDGGSMVGQRLIPEEPMSIVLNLGMSANWQTIDLQSMQFPAEMKVDYVRVYQRKGHTNTGCDPKEYPTAKYIQSHLQAYTDVNMTAWPYEKPKNSQYDGC